MSAHAPLVIAHRGAAASLPENTLEAFRLATGPQGADMIELDIHLTRDGVPVILHDAKLERTTNGTGFVAEKNWASLKDLDAAYFFDPKKDGAFPRRGRAVRIPKFEEMLAEFRASPLALEIKPKSEELVHKVVALVKKYGASQHVIVGSKHHLISRTLERDYPEIRRFSSQRQVCLLAAEFQSRRKQLRQTPGQVASVPSRCLGFSFHRKAWIDFLHARGIEAFFWTVDEPETMRRLRDWGADGIITNNPKLAKDALQ